MFPLYLKILALNIGLSNFIVLMVAVVNGGALKSRDFVFPVAIQFLVVSLIFIVLNLLQPHTGHAGSEVRKEASLEASLSEAAAHKTPVREFRTASFSATEFGAAKQNSAKG